MDLFSRRIVGWATSSRTNTEFALGALEQAIWQRRTVKVAASQASYTTGDHGSQYLSIAYSDRLLAEGTDTSTGRVGSSYDNAAAEALSKSYKCELIWTRSWKDCDDLEAAVAEWVD